MRWAIEADDEREKPADSFPRSVRAAGIFWVGTGLLIAVSVLVFEISFAASRSSEPGKYRHTPLLVLDSLINLVTGVSFFIAGLRVIRGPRDVLGVSIASALIGFLFALVGVIIAIYWPPQADLTFYAFFTTLNIVAGVALMLSAGLAVAGRASYLDWRAARVSRQIAMAKGPSSARPWMRAQARTDYDL